MMLVWVKVKRGNFILAIYTPEKKKKKKKGCKEGGNEKICSQGVQIRVIINKPYIKEQQDEIQYGVILISNIHYITI